MQFDRVIRSKIRLIDSNYIDYRGTLEVENLRIAFSVFKSESWSTNNASVRIWNLSSSSRNSLAHYGDELTLFAGYRDDGGAQLLFLGNTTQVSHIFAEPEIITVLDCGDGDKTLNNTVVSLSFSANTPVRTVIEGFANRLGLQVVEFTPTDNFVYNTGFKYSGIAKDGLDKACKRLGLTWSVQNGNLIILKESQGAAKPPAEINANTGMIGIPQRYTDKRQSLYRVGPNVGWKVRTLLRPDILPGDRVRIRSQKVDIDGLFYVISIRHEGDNFGPEFESQLEVIAV